MWSCSQVGWAPGHADVAKTRKHTEQRAQRAQHAQEPLTLKETTRSWEEIYPESYVLLQASSIYAVFQSGGEYRLGRFDEVLQLISQSEEVVDRDSAFFLFGDKIYINSSTRDILVLNREDLKEEGLIR